MIEQYSQGNQDIMIRLKELQRRMDQTLGPPIKQNDKNRAKFTIGARLLRVEDSIEQIHLKLDRCISMISFLPDLKNYKVESSLEYESEQNKNECEELSRIVKRISDK